MDQKNRDLEYPIVIRKKVGEDNNAVAFYPFRIS